jgi:hypothetical protein
MTPQGLLTHHSQQNGGDSGDKLPISSNHAGLRQICQWGHCGDRTGTKWGHFYKMKNPYSNSLISPGTTQPISLARRTVIRLRTLPELGAKGPSLGATPRGLEKFDTEGKEWHV